MTAKEYLSQVRYIDGLIDSKLEQLERVKTRVAKATMTLSDTRRSGASDSKTQNATVAKIANMERDIDAEVDKLVNLKREIMGVIDKVRNPFYKALLEMRYLYFMSWEDIAYTVDRDITNVYRARHNALRVVERIIESMQNGEIRIQRMRSHP